jgi:hypothetical protein
MSDLLNAFLFVTARALPAWPNGVTTHRRQRPPMSPRRLRDPPGHGGASLGALDCLRCNRRCDGVGLVLGLGLEREEAAQLAFDLGTVGSGLVEQRADLVVVLAGGSRAEACAADRVGGVDAGMDGETRRRDVAAAFGSLAAASANSCALAA